MAPRYGDHEDLARAIREAQELAKQTDALTGKEIARAEETRAGARSDETAVSRSRQLTAARREAEEVARRAAQVADQEARSLDVSTAAIERNRRAREQATQVQRRAEAMQRGALQGARDPLFAQASQIQPQSQYEMRRQLAIGQERAARLQAASVAGFRPQTDPMAVTQPFTRSMAAEIQLEAAEGELSRATRDLTNSRRRKSTTDEERGSLLQVRDAARQQRDAARTELESARKEAESVQRRATVAQAEQVAARQPGNALIPHPTEFGQRVPGPFGPVVQQRGVVAEGGVMGQGRGYAPPVRGVVQAATNDVNEYTRALSDQERAANEIRRQRLDSYYSNISAQELKASAATRQSAVSFGMASQAMTRHGALSSEFIQAAARGETTVRELGSQALVTAGKFGGWIAVGAGIYALTNAVHQVGTGALQSASGVDQLRRVVDNVNADQAQGDFSRLAGQFNVPIATSADAVYRMGQVFHNQADATEAATAALYAYKTGGVEVGLGTQQLISITQAFGLSSKDLASTFDQVNQAQNEFGATIPDILAGLSKSGGSFRQAGGDLNYLLAIMVAIQRATGRTGQEIGTGLARGVNQFRLPTHQAALRAQGVDVDPENFQKTLQSAMKAAQRPGADLNAIANGLLGNQYGRLLTAVLADQTTLNKAVKDLPTKGPGSSARELANVMHQADEQITLVGTHLQQIGAGLAQAGAFDALYLGLRALNGMLGLADDLLHVFNSLPAPIRHLVTLFGEGYVLLAAMRRLGATDSVAGGPLGFLSNPDQRLQTYAQRGLRDSRDAARNEYEGFRRREYRAALGADIAQQEVSNFQPQLARAQNLPIDHPERVAAEQRGEMLMSNQTRAERELSRARAEAAGAQKVLQRSEEDLLAVERLRSTQVREYLHATGVPIPQEIGKPSSAGTTVLTRGGQEFDVSTRTDRLRALAQQDTALNGRIAEWQTAASQRVSQTGARLEALAGANGGLGRAAQGLERGAQRVVAGGARGANFLTNAVGAFRGVPAALGGIAAALGPLDLALIGLTVGLVGLDKLKESYRHANEFIDETNRFGQSAQEYRSMLQSAANKAQGPSPFEQSVKVGLGPLGAALYQGRDQEREAARQQQDIEKRRQEAIRSAQRRGTPRPLLMPSDLMRDIERDAQLRKDGIISQQEFDRRMAQHAVEAKVLYQPSRVQLAAVRTAYADAARAQGKPADFATSLKGLDQKHLSEQAQAIATQVGAFGGTDRALLQARQVYGEAVARWGSRDDPASIQALSEARTNFFDLIEKTANDEVKRGLASARNEGDRQSVYTNAQHLVSRNLTQNANARVDQAQNRLNDAQAKLLALSTLRDSQPVNTPQRQGATDAVNAQLRRVQSLQRVLKRSSAELKAAERKAQDLQNELKQAAFDDREQGRSIQLALGQASTPDDRQDARMAIRSAQAGVRDAAATFGRQSRQYQQALTTLYTAREQAAQATLAHVQAENALLTAQAGTDPVAQARAGVQGARNVLAEMQGKDKGRFSNDQRTQAQADLITAQNSYDDAMQQQAQQLTQLQGQIASARANGDPVAVARAAQQAARRATATAKTPVERSQALLDTITANNELESALADREAARQKAIASKTDDPVATARAERIAAQRNLKRQKPGTQSYYEGVTRLNEARRAEVQSQIDETTNDIEFERTMGTVSIDDAVSRYQTLLQTRNLTKQQKRTIMTAIKNLQDEAQNQAQGFNLDVGSLQLPTAYDVRRAFDPIRQQVKRQVKEAAGAATGAGLTGGTRAPTLNADNSVSASVDKSVSTMYDQRAQISAQVNVYVSDRNAVADVYEALDRVLGTTVRAKARSAGRRG